LFLLLSKNLWKIILFLHFLLKNFGFLCIVLKHLLKRLNLTESKEFSVEFCKYFFVISLSGVSLTSLHHPNRCIYYFHYKLSVVLIFAQFYIFKLPKSIITFYFWIQVLWDFDVVAVNQVVFLIIHSVDFVNDIVHSQCASWNRRLRVVGCLVIKYGLYDTLHSIEQIQFYLVQLRIFFHLLFDGLYSLWVHGFEVEHKIRSCVVLDFLMFQLVVAEVFERYGKNVGYSL